MSINIIIIALFAMIFCHIVDDYYLQGWLASSKEKQWWVKQDSFKPMYKYDYIVALGMHSMSWSFMIMLPLLIASKFSLGWLLLAYPINALIHGIVDDLKANKGCINLWTDQSLHMVQILITWLVWWLV